MSDVHGATDALSHAADGSDLLVCLGDLILFLDYAQPERGIYSELFGVEHTRAYIQARTEGRFDDARELASLAWARRGIVDPVERRAALEVKIAEQYAELFAVLPPALLTYGNVDVPSLWPRFLRPGHVVLDGDSIDIGGLRMGFVGGGLVSPMRTPYERTPADFAASLARLGPVDILFTHIPAANPGLMYDTVARRFESGSRAIVDYIDAHRPALHLYGHVHQPLRERWRHRSTECMNVGHFAGRRRPFVIDL